MDDEVDARGRPRQRHRHRVDDERHVVGDDVDHRVRRGPAVLFGVGVVDADVGLPGAPRTRQLPVLGRRAVQVALAAAREIGPGYPVVVLANECLDDGSLAVGKPVADSLANRVDQL